MINAYTNNMEDYTPVWRQRKYVTIALALVVLLILFVQLSRYSFVEVQVDAGSGNPEVNYQIRNQVTQGTTDQKTTSTKVRKLLPKGNYEILVHSDQGSAFSITSATGFFTKVIVRVKLQPEKQRQFVGNNPSGCMFYLGQILYSYTCGDSTSSLTTHVPATSSEPTYTIKNDAGITGIIEGSSSSKDGVNMLVRSISTEDSSGPLHTMYTLGPGLKILNAVHLPNLENGTTYNMSAYNGGFVIYDQAFSSVYYYSLSTPTASRISIDKPIGSNQKPFTFATDDTNFLAMYSSKADADNNDNPKPLGKVTSELFIGNNDKTKRVTLTRNYTKQITTAQPCGTNKLCILVDRTLYVYNISGSKASYLYMVTGVSHIWSSGPSLLVIRDDGILNLNIDSKNGYTDYAFGDYKYCGIQSDSTGYLLCLTNKDSKNIALRIDQKATNADSIDKKVLELQGLSDITDVSAYGTYIFMTPDLGELVYNEDTHEFGYDTNTKNLVNGRIATQIQKIGIDTSRYQLINTSN